MKCSATLLFCLVLSGATMLYAEAPSSFATDWISSKPEVLTYRSTSGQGEGLYQVSIFKRDSIIEIYMNIISPGFTKTVCGTMTAGMIPLRSTSKIIVNGQVVMDTKCKYDPDKVNISTTMLPYNQTMANAPSFTTPVIDFSQVPILARTLQLKIGAGYTFSSLNPQTNTLMPLSVNVVGEGPVGGNECYKVEQNDFEGLSIYWIEKGEQRRVMKIEQPQAHRVTELIEQH